MHASSVATSAASPSRLVSTTGAAATDAFAAATRRCPNDSGFVRKAAKKSRDPGGAPSAANDADT